MNFGFESVFAEIFRNEIFVQRITDQGNGHRHHSDQNDQGKIYNRAMMDNLIHFRANI
jgi:hypothetical protein